MSLTTTKLFAENARSSSFTSLIFDLYNDAGYSLAVKIENQQNLDCEFYLVVGTSQINTWTKLDESHILVNKKNDVWIFNAKPQMYRSVYLNCIIYSGSANFSVEITTK